MSFVPIFMIAMFIIAMILRTGSKFLCFLKGENFTEINLDESADRKQQSSPPLNKTNLENWSHMANRYLSPATPEQTYD